MGVRGSRYIRGVVEGGRNPQKYSKIDFKSPVKPFKIVFFASGRVDHGRIPQIDARKNYTQHYTSTGREK